MKREVTEDDLRLPEFRGVALKDLEVRADGKVVRKDRWERAVFTLADLVGMNRREGFEIDEVVEAVKAKLRGEEPTLAHVDLARRICTVMGVAISPSREPGADIRVDMLAESLASWGVGGREVKPEFERALAAPMLGGLSGTVRDYFTEILVTLWEEGEGFSGKRPLGNSDWEWEVLAALVGGEHWPGTYEDGQLLSVDNEPAARIFVKNMLVYVMGGAKC